MKVGTGRAARGAGVAEDVAFLYEGTVGDSQFRHMEKHGGEALAVIDADGVAKNVEVLCEDDFSVGDGTNFFACRGALIDATVKFTGGFSIVKTLHAEGRGDAAIDGRGEGILPKAGVGHSIAEIREELNLFGSGAKGFDIRTQANVLRWKFRRTNDK